MIRKILLILSFIAVFVAGMVVAAVSHFGSPIITIKVVNKSSKEIKTVNFIHETGKSQEVEYRISNIAPGKERALRIYVPAESSYKLFVTFVDQKRLVGGQGYIEPGYKIVETVMDNKIQSDLNAFGGYGP
jgi:hypothetical protein